jgi:Flp pilus assembly protein CpaB
VESITSSKLFTTRQGTVLLGVIAAVIAAIALIVYLNHYRNSVGSAATVQVLVASKLIQQGTSGDVLRTNPSYYETQNISKSNVESNAIQDPATLAGLTATTDISPGQQLTESDFSSTGATGIASNLNPHQRAVVVALGSPQAVGNQITAGSHVDFWVLTSSASSNGVTRSIAKLLFQDMYVMGVNGGNVTLRATPTQAGQIIFASTNDSIWLVLRPTVGSVTKPPVIGTRQVTGG